ncbi:unnamed protein product [Toxocara canis]|uniref:Filaggrin n=1 Tax=Toxocara canis TaxID=6265 RepID=A0A183TYP6_TOXCA|nr:unnamed protein product [Toxocara canis]
MLLLLTPIVLTWSVVGAGQIHPQVKKELDELHLIFGDLGIPQPELTALATELALKADEPDAEALLYNDFKRRLSSQELRRKFDDKIQQLHLYDMLIDKFVQVVGNENLADFKTDKATFGDQLQTVEEHIGNLIENVKRGSSNELFMRLSNLLAEFEKIKLKATPSSARPVKSDTKNSSETDADVKSDGLSIKQTAMPEGDGDVLIINGKVWPKDSLHHIPKWLEAEYRKESKLEPESTESTGDKKSSTKVSAIEEEYTKNRKVTPKISRFQFYQQKVVTSSEEADVIGTTEENEQLLKASINFEDSGASTYSKESKQKPNLHNSLRNEEKKQYEGEEGTLIENAKVIIPADRKIKGRLPSQTKKTSSSTEARMAENDRNNIYEERQSTEHPTSLSTTEPVLGKSQLDFSEKELSTKKLEKHLKEKGVHDHTQIIDSASDEQEIYTTEPSQVDEGNSKEKTSPQSDSDQTSEEDPDGTTESTLSTEDSGESGEQLSKDSASKVDNAELSSNHSQSSAIVENAELLSKSPREHAKKSHLENARYSTWDATSEGNDSLLRAEITGAPATTEVNNVNSVSSERTTADQNAETKVSSTIVSPLPASSTVPVSPSADEILSEINVAAYEMDLKSQQTTSLIETSTTEQLTRIDAIFGSQSSSTVSLVMNSLVENVFNTLTTALPESTMLSTTEEVSNVLTAANDGNERLAASGANTNRSEGEIGTTEIIDAQSEDGIEDITANDGYMTTAETVETAQVARNSANIDVLPSEIKFMSAARGNEENVSDNAVNVAHSANDESTMANGSSEMEEQVRQDHNSTDKILLLLEGEANNDTQSNSRTQNSNKNALKQQLSNRPTEDNNHLQSIEVSLNTTARVNNMDELVMKSGAVENANTNENGIHREFDEQEMIFSKAEDGSGEEEKA